MASIIVEERIRQWSEWDVRLFRCIRNFVYAEQVRAMRGAQAQCVELLAHIQVLTIFWFSMDERTCV